MTAAAVRYVTAREVARVIGCTEYRLDTTFRPSHWGSPRDFCVTSRGVVCYAQDKLPELAEELELLGAVAAASQLRTWAASLQTALPAESWATRWEREHDR